MEKCSDKKEDVTNAILAFDTFTTTNHMKMLKLLLPYLGADRQKKLAVYIKWQELLFTLQFFNRYSASLYSGQEKKQQSLNLQEAFPLLTPYCNEKEKKILSQFMQLQNTMNMMDEMQQYIPMIQEFMSAMSQTQDSKENIDTNNLMELLKNMMSEEQQTMFSMFMDNNPL